MKRKLFLLAFLLLPFLLPAQAEAAQGIGLAPAVQEVELKQDAAAVTFEILVSNTTGSTADLRVSTLDFGALDESGGIAFLGRTGQETTRYGLKQWMVLEKDRLTLEPGQTQTIKITVENKESLGPGGHYGAVVVGADSGTDSNTDSVAVLPAASTLVLLKKTGGEKLVLELDSVKANSSLISLPGSSTLRFKNAGNTHLVPRGTIEIFDPFGKTVSRAVINESSSYILPESFRLYEQDFASQRTPWLPGRYKQVTTWRYDGTGTTYTMITYHWYVGAVVLSGIGILCLLIVLFLYIRYRRRPVTRN